MTFLEAIFHEEGFYKEGSRPQRNNNPGDLLYCVESVRFGASGSDGRFAVFPSVEVGKQAARRWLSVPARFDRVGNLVGGYMGASVEQVINRFAPPFENDTTTYVKSVCEKANVHPEDIVDESMLEL